KFAFDPGFGSDLLQPSDYLIGLCQRQRALAGSNYYCPHVTAPSVATVVQLKLSYKDFNELRSTGMIFGKAGRARLTEQTDALGKANGTDRRYSMKNELF